jgi:sulfur-carrier protein adenylyltransferase/sulfurtransferase
VSLTWQKLIEKVKGEIKEITPEDLNQQLSQGNITVIDIRENEELSTGHLPNAIFIPRGFLELRIESTVPERNQAICLYCGGGNRSALAARSLQELGYTKVFSLEGGISRWIRENRRIHLPKEPDIDPQ